MKFFIFTPLQHEYIHVRCIRYEFIHIFCLKLGKFTFIYWQKTCPYGRSIYQISTRGCGNHTKEFFMRSFKLLGIIALVAVMVSVTGCVTATSIGGTAEGHGLFAASSGRAAEEGATKIASYSVIMGLFDAGYKSYASEVKAAEAGGKQITSVTRFYYFLSITTAYGK
jgi:hypothetical protein